MKTTRHETTSGAGASRRRVGIAAGAAMLLVAFSTPSAVAAAGDLDPSFGVGGVSAWSPTTQYDHVSAVVHQSDGKIVSVGHQTREADGGPTAFLVSRHNTDGSLDSSFGGGDGVVITDLGLGDRANGVAVQPDGRIVVAGQVQTGGHDLDHALVRYEPSGDLDPSFGGGDGIVVVGVAEPTFPDNARDVAIDGTGRIVTAGSVLVRFTADGSLDTSFGGGDGFVDSGIAHSLAIQADGKLVVGGESGFNFVLARYTADGSPDPMFSGDGSVVLNLGGQDRVHDVAVDALDRIVAAGPGSQAKLHVVRLTPIGELDTTFSGNGIAKAGTVMVSSSTNPLQRLGLAVQADGKPVVGGPTGSAVDFAVTRFTVGGALDTTFGGGDGVATFDFAADDDLGTSVSLDVAGNIVVGGSTDGPTNPDNSHDGQSLLLRYQADLSASACPGMTITNTVAGTPGDDTLVGTPGSDFIYGLGGNDTITGGDGDDCIYGGAGDDLVDAGIGNDRLFAESGIDTITGGTGLDKVVGGPGNDTIRIAAGEVPAASTEILKGKAGTDAVELGVGLSTTDVTGVPPTFSVNDPTTAGTYSAVKVEVIVDT